MPKDDDNSEDEVTLSTADKFTRTMLATAAAFLAKTAAEKGFDAFKEWRKTRDNDDE